jgi:hypothetical protein
MKPYSIIVPLVALISLLGSASLFYVAEFNIDSLEQLAQTRAAPETRGEYGDSATGPAPVTDRNTLPPATGESATTQSAQMNSEPAVSAPFAAPLPLTEPVTIQSEHVQAMLAVEAESSENLQQTAQRLVHFRDLVAQRKALLKKHVTESMNTSITHVQQSQGGSSSAVYTAQSITTTGESVLRDIDTTFQNISPLLMENDIQKLGTRIETSLTHIEGIVEEETKEKLSLSNQKDSIRQALTFSSENSSDGIAALSVKELQKVYLDTDQDGLSDYDEEVVYKTNPRKAYSIRGEYSDFEKVFRGLDPLSVGTTSVTYEEPKNTAVILSLLSVDDVAAHNVVTYDGGQQQLKSVLFKGKAIPNSIVTLYIYSTPIIVVVKANNNGEWSYVLDTELEDGSHEVYAAVVNNSGKVLARSSSLPFIKQASAITLDQSDLLRSEEVKGGFMRKYFFWITSSIVIFGLIITLAIVGMANKNSQRLPPQ